MLHKLCKKSSNSYVYDQLSQDFPLGLVRRESDVRDYRIIKHKNYKWFPRL
jgi:hypothetical protein